MIATQRRKLTRFRVALGFGLLLSWLSTEPVRAQAAPQTPVQTTTGTAHAGSPNTPEWWVWVRRAERFVREVQYAAAGGALERALMLAPDEPVAHHHLGEVHRLRGDLQMALREFRTAGRLAAAQENRRFEARALYNIAETLERMVGRLPEARSAWEDLRLFGEQHPDVIAPQIARARVAAIDRASDQELVYREVRTMIRREVVREPATEGDAVDAVDEETAEAIEARAPAQEQAAE